VPPRFPRATGAALLAMGALLLTQPFAEARLEQAGKPGEAVESGGRSIPPGSRPRPGCLEVFLPGLDYALFAPFSFGAACFGLQAGLMPWRLARALALSSLAWIARRTASVVVARP
jgi:hypothetical protein